MRNLLALLALAALTFAGLGWYLGWYQVNSEPTSLGHQNINIDINGSKIRSDVRKVQKGIQDTKRDLQENAESN